ncbi:MAG: TerB family tellurite resistance protein [Rhodovibrionaceae bacterium]
MSIWGKIVGGAAGFALGGPLGAVLGVVAGHAVDSMRNSVGELPSPDGRDDATKNVAFTIGVIVLGAKMAKADGVVTREEVAAFKQVFHIPDSEMKNVGRIFDQARKDARGYEPYAKQLAGMFNDNPAVLEELLNGLFHIARADGQVTEAEAAYLEDLARIFGLEASQWDRLRAANTGEPEEHPYNILGIDPEASDEEIKAEHRKLVRENHPDRLVAQGMPQEFVDTANQKLAAINAAYDKIKRERGL